MPCRPESFVSKFEPVKEWIENRCDQMLSFVPRGSHSPPLLGMHEGDEIDEAVVIGGIRQRCPARRCRNG